MSKKILFLLIVLLLFKPSALSAEVVTTKYQGALGVQLVGGEVQTTLLRADLLYNFNRKWDHEWTAKLRSDFQSADGRELISKHLGFLRYGKSINDQLYWFSRLDLEKDQIRNLNARYGAVLGLGHWFSDGANFTFIVESSAGRYTDHLLDRTLEDYSVLQFREEFDKRLYETLRLSQEFFVSNLINGHRYILSLDIENSISRYWSIVLSADYDLAAYDDGTRQEGSTFIMELRFDYEVIEEE